MIDFNHKYFVYRHVRHDKNEPFYVGAGTVDAGRGIFTISRYFRAYSKHGRNKKWESIVNKSAFDVEIVYTCDSMEISHEKEKEFIELYGRIDMGTGSLCNETDGGWGNNGIRKDILSAGQTNRQGKEAYEAFLDSKRKPVYLYDMQGNYVSEYKTKNECAAEFNTNRCSIFDAVRLKKPYFGYYFFNDFGGAARDISKMAKGYATRTIPLVRIDESGEITGIYKGPEDAASKNDISDKSIYQSIETKKRIKGYIWQRIPLLHLKEKLKINEIRYS